MSHEFNSGEILGYTAKSNADPSQTLLRREFLSDMLFTWNDKNSSLQRVVLEIRVGLNLKISIISRAILLYDKPN